MRAAVRWYFLGGSRFARVVRYQCLAGLILYAGWFLFLR